MEVPQAKEHDDVAAALEDAMNVHPLHDFQPRFRTKHVVNEIELGRKYWMVAFPQHFTRGIGGLDSCDEDLTETEFIVHCLHYHTRQFSSDFEFICTAYHRRRKRVVSGICIRACE